MDQSKKAILELMKKDPDQTKFAPWRKTETEEIKFLIKEGFTNKVIIKHKQKWTFKNRTDEAILHRLRTFRRKMELDSYGQPL